MEHSSDYIGRSTCIVHSIYSFIACKNLVGTPNELMLIAERDKLQRKLNKVQQRRDHYARLYYRTLAQLDDAKLELVQAKHKIQKFQQLSKQLKSSANVMWGSSKLALIHSLVIINKYTHAYPCSN